MGPEKQHWTRIVPGVAIAMVVLVAIIVNGAAYLEKQGIILGVKKQQVVKADKCSICGQTIEVFSTNQEAVDLASWDKCYCAVCQEIYEKLGSCFCYGGSRAGDLYHWDGILYRDQNARQEIDERITRWEQGNVRLGEKIDIVVIIRNFGKSPVKGPFRLVVKLQEVLDFGDRLTGRKPKFHELAFLEVGNPKIPQGLATFGFEITEEAPIGYIEWRVSKELGEIRVKKDLNPEQPLAIEIKLFQGIDCIGDDTFFLYILGPA